MVSAQQLDLIGVQHLQSEEIRHALQAGHAPVHIVPQKQELSGGEVHAQLPDVVCEEVQVLQVAVDVSEYIHWWLHEQAPGLLFHYLYINNNNNNTYIHTLLVKNLINKFK